MKFRYLGKKEDMKVFGYDFTNGNTPDVTEAVFIAKLSGNSHFEAVKESRKKPVEPATVEPAVDLDSQTEWPV
jgi:hypothetical protein